MRKVRKDHIGYMFLVNLLHTSYHLITLGIRPEPPLGSLAESCDPSGLRRMIWRRQDILVQMIWKFIGQLEY